MSVFAKIPLSGLSRGELEALAERLLAENAALRQALRRAAGGGGDAQGREGPAQGEAQRYGEGYRA